jgi:type I restriction enzyme, S subunit
VISKETLRGGFPIKDLGDVAEFLDSQRRPITASDRVPGPYPYYGANGQQDSVADYIFDEPLILLAEDGGLFDQPDRGIAYAIEGKTWVNNHAHVLRARDDVQQEYLVRVLENYDVTPWITGSTRAKLTKAGASRIQIPLPPLAEQKRIAGILDAADALRAKRRESLAQLDTLLQSTFIDMFGDPVTNPMGWGVGSLQDVTKKITDGTHKTPKYTDSGVEFLSAKDLKDGKVRWNSGKFISPEEHEQLIKRCNPEPGDLLLAKSGSLGSVAIINRAHEFSLFESLCLIKRDPEKIDAPFLASMIRNPTMQVYLLGKNKGVAIKHLHLVDVRGLKILIPPLDQQHRFRAIVESFEKQKASQRAHLDELDTLFASLQSRAFRGDL